MYVPCLGSPELLRAKVALEMLHHQMTEGGLGLPGPCKDYRFQDLYKEIRIMRNPPKFRVQVLVRRTAVGPVGMSICRIIVSECVTHSGPHRAFFASSLKPCGSKHGVCRRNKLV